MFVILVEQFSLMVAYVHRRIPTCSNQIHIVKFTWEYNHHSFRVNLRYKIQSLPSKIFRHLPVSVFLEPFIELKCIKIHLLQNVQT